MQPKGTWRLLGLCPSHAGLEPVQERPDARRKEALRAERTESYVSTQGRLTTPQMAIHGQAPLRAVLFGLVPPHIQPPADFALVALVGGVVVAAARETLGGGLLLHAVAGVIVRVAVALGVALGLHQLGGRVAQVERDGERTGLVDLGRRLAT